MIPAFVLSGAGWAPFRDWSTWRFLLEGLALSLQIAGYSIALSIVVGVLMSVGRLAPARPVRWIAGTYVEVFRAMPLLLLLFFIFFGSAHFAKQVSLDLKLVSLDFRVGSFGPLTSAVIALTLYNGAVVAEIMRAGIVSISRGIIEASRALGLSYLQSMRFVIIPMALRRMAPGLVSQLITLFKDTSLASLITVLELLRRARVIYDSPVYNNTVEVLTVVAVMYFVPCYVLSLVAQRLEQDPSARLRRVESIHEH